MAGIGFFAPLPLAMMLPFMAGQSMIMGDSFGKAYQYGKRKISAMSNEEFNKLTMKDLAQEMATDFSTIIPAMSQAIRDSTHFQSLIIQEMGEIIKSLPTEISQFFGIDTPEGTTGSATDTFSQLAVAILKLINAGGLPEAFAEHGTTPPPNTIPDPQNRLETIQTENGLQLSLFAIKAWRFVDLNNAMSAITKGNSPYTPTTQREIRKEWNKQRDKQSQDQRDQQQNREQRQEETNEEINRRLQQQKPTKRPAGQSVKLERNKLILEISKQSKRILNIRDIKWGSGQSQSTRENIRRRVIASNTKIQKEINILQLKLADLLIKYDFGSG